MSGATLTHGAVISGGSSDHHQPWVTTLPRSPPAPSHHGPSCSRALFILTGFWSSDHRQPVRGTSSEQRACNIGLGHWGSNLVCSLLQLPALLCLAMGNVTPATFCEHRNWKQPTPKKLPCCIHLKNTSLKQIEEPEKKFGKRIFWFRIFSSNAIHSTPGSTVYCSHSQKYSSLATMFLFLLQLSTIASPTSHYNFLKIGNKVKF